MKAYELLADVPALPKGAIFVHDKRDAVRGSPAYGCLKLAWDNGNCQHSWCGEVVVFPGQLTNDAVWFKKIKNPRVKDNRTRRFGKRRYH